MRSISKEILVDLLELILEKATLVINRNQSITCAQDFLTSPDRMEKFDAACMLIQVVGETAKKIDDRTSFGIIKKYLPELVVCVKQILSDVEAGKHDSLFLSWNEE